MRRDLRVLLLASLAGCATGGGGYAPARAAPAVAADSLVTHPPAPGQLARVLDLNAHPAPRPTLTGTFRGLTADAVVLQRRSLPADRLDTVPLGAGRRLQLLVGRHDNRRAGFLIGLVVGAGVGGVLGSGCTQGGVGSPDLCALAQVGGLVGGGLIGGGLGLTIGKAVTTDDWRTVLVQGPERSSRTTVGLRVTF